MGDCGVCIGGDSDGYCDFHNIEFRKARKAHVCCECRKVISPGERYQIVSDKYEGVFFFDKTCAICAEIRTAFADGNSIEWGALWEEMGNYAFPEMTTGCFDRLDTPEAKEELRRRWLAWKGLVTNG